MSPTVEPAFVEPAYGSRSLVDVVPAVGAAIGVKHRPDEQVPGGLRAAGSPGVRRVPGRRPRRAAAAAARRGRAVPRLAARSTQEPGTAGVPSTTATSLSSLGTALPPGAHGLVGFTSRIPGTDRLLNALAWDKQVDPKEWQPHATAFTGLRLNGASVTVINKREFRGSGLTVAAHRGRRLRGRRPGRGAARGGRRGVGERPSLTYLYDGDLDWTGHRYGVASAQWLQQLVMVDAEAEQLRESLPPDVRLLVIADHGMVDSPTLVTRRRRPPSWSCATACSLMGGEARFRHLYCRNGAIDDVAATWRSVLGDRADVLTREEAIGRGWFGPVEPLVLPRLGDVVVACRGDHAVVSTVDFAYESTLIGLHGSLTADEMLIPLLVD